MKTSLIKVILIFSILFTLSGYSFAQERFVLSDDGLTVIDMKTGLMWAGTDNRSDVTWQAAKNYCSNYSTGGFTDWKMPSDAELMSIYDSSVKDNKGYSVNRLITLSSCFVWENDNSGLSAGKFNFCTGIRAWDSKETDYGIRVLPVRVITEQERQKLQKPIIK
jgi:hypothetical protein